MLAAYVLMRDSDGDAVGEQRYEQTAAPVTGFVVLNFRQRCGRGPYSQRGGAVRQTLGTKCFALLES
jgi:hypothetical protein